MRRAHRAGCSRPVLEIRSRTEIEGLGALATTVVREPATLSAPSLMSLPQRTKFAILGAVLLTMFLASLDQTVVGTALPRIVTHPTDPILYAYLATAHLLP